MPDPRCAGIVWVLTNSTECVHYFVAHEEQDYPDWTKFVCKKCGSIMYNINGLPNVRKDNGKVVGPEWMPAHKGFNRMSCNGDG